MGKARNQASKAIFFFVFISPVWACPKYDRDLYPNWIDADNDCQNARAEVLIRDSKGPVKFRGGGDCSVDSGRWDDPYTGQTLVAAADIEIDHVVALAEAHRSKAWMWTAPEKTRFANFLDSAYHLLPVASAANQAKSDLDPAEWLPPRAAYHAEFAAIWVKIKRHWNLTADSAELSALRRLLPNVPGSAFPVLAPEDSCTEVMALFQGRKPRNIFPGSGFAGSLIGTHRLDGRRVLEIVKDARRETP